MKDEIPEILEQSSNGYWCVICGKYLPEKDGVIVHDDNVVHPECMAFDEDDNPQ